MGANAMSGLPDYFDRIYVINLPARTDRRREMAEQLAKVNLGFDDPRIGLFSAIHPDHAAGFESIGTRGCFLSHLEVLRDARHNSFDRILILEDDLNFTPDFLQRCPAALSALAARNWELFYGGYQFPGKSVPPAGADGLAVVASVQPVQTAHFLGFQQPVIARMIEFLEALLRRPAGDPDGGPMHVDGAYTRYRQLHPGAVTLAAVPELGYQRSSRTDIHDLRWFDRLPVIRETIGGLRRVKNSLRP
jgi:hypothetical protein